MTTYKNFNRACYTVKLMLPELKRAFLKYKKNSHGLMDNYVSLPRIHMGLKYLGYEDKYSEKHMKELIPALREVARKHLPVKIKLKGLGAFWSRPAWPRRNPAIFLKVVLNKKLHAFHKDILKAVAGKGDTFLMAEGKNYHPHVSLGNGRNDKIRELKKLVKSSKHDKPITITAHRMAMRLRSTSIHYVLKA